MRLVSVLARIPSGTVLGKLARLPLRIIPRGSIVRIRSGPLKGHPWIVAAGVHGNWLGTYEREVQDAIVRTVESGGVFYDVGAHAGYHALLASALVGPAGRVVAFEPDTRNLSYLKQHLKLNRAANVTVIEAAVADGTGAVSFARENSGFGGALSEGGTTRVRTVTLDELVEGGVVPPPNYLKIDVEGAEFRVLRGVARVLKAFRPVLFLATHTPETEHLCAQTLTQLSYTGEPITCDAWLYMARH